MHLSELAFKSECLLKSEEPRGPCLPYPSPSPGPCPQYKSGTNKWLIMSRICLILFILWRLPVCFHILPRVYNWVLQDGQSVRSLLSHTGSGTLRITDFLSGKRSQEFSIQLPNITNWRLTPNQVKKLCHRVNHRERQYNVTSNVVVLHYATLQ